MTMRRLLWLIVFVEQGCFGAPPDSLLFTQIVFCHGDSSPAHGLPNLTRGVDEWPNGYNQLTQLGMQQSRDLGKFIRKTYGGFINSTYLTQEIYVRSSDEDRTLMSAYAVLAGLYPPQGFQQWDEDINWQPIPVHTVDIENDIELGEVIPCPFCEALLAKAIASEEGQQLYEDNKYLIGNTTEKAGYEAATFMNTWRLTVTLTAMKTHDVSWPDWVTDDIFSQLEEFYFNYYNYWFYYKQQLHLRIGPLLRLLDDGIQSVVNRETEEDKEDKEEDKGDNEENKEDKTKKMIIYASHDTTLAGVSLALGVFNRSRSPSFASALLLELHKDENDTYSVRMLYKNDTENIEEGEAVPLDIPGCDGSVCPLATFQQLLDPTMYTGSLEDWKKDSSVEKENVGYSTHIAITVVAVTLCVIIIPMLFCCARKSCLCKRVQYEET